MEPRQRGDISDPLLGTAEEGGAPDRRRDKLSFRRRHPCCCGYVVGSTVSTAACLLAIAAMVSVAWIVMNNTSNGDDGGNHQHVDPTGTVVTETETGKQFSTEMMMADGKKHKLLGAGARHTSYQFKIMPYAMGFYVEPKKAADALKPFKSESEEKRRSDDEYFKKLIDGTFSHTIRMVSNTNLITSGIFQQIVDREVRPNIIDRIPDRAAANKLADDFYHCFDGKSFKDGVEVLLTCSEKPESNFYITHQGSLLCTFKNNPILCDSFFSLYLGSPPMEPGLRASFAKYLNSLYEGYKTEEGETGFKFVSPYFNPLTNERENLLGVGARHIPKRHIPFMKAYTVAGAVAMMVSHDADLSQFRNVPAKDLINNQDYFDAVANGPFSKSIMFKTSIDVDVGTFVNTWMGIEKKVESRYDKSRGQAASYMLQAAIADVIGETILSGVTIVMSCARDSELKEHLIVSVQSKKSSFKQDDVQEALCWGMWQALVGPDHGVVDLQLKRRMADISTNWM